MDTIIECYGCLTKVEKLWCLEEFGIQNTCILESREVFPGYYERFTQHLKPRHVFIMSKEKHSLEEISRINAAVKKTFPIPFDAAYCEITFRNKVCGGVRITGIDDYSIVKDLQTVYGHCGLDMKKKVSDIDNEEAVIKVRKFFKLKVLHDQIFIDTIQKDIGYFIVENDVSWIQFEKNIKLLKNNWTGHSFDAAKSFIYQNSTIIDMVRIYSKDLQPVFIQEVRDAYLKFASM